MEICGCHQLNLAAFLYVQAIEILIEQLASAAAPSAEGPETKSEVSCTNREESTSEATSQLPESAQTWQPLDAPDACSGPSEACQTEVNESRSANNIEVHSTGPQCPADSHKDHEVGCETNQVRMPDTSCSSEDISELQSTMRQLDRLHCSSAGVEEGAESNTKIPLSSGIDSCGTVGSSSSQQQVEAQTTKQRKAGKLQIAVGKKPARNRECPCGSSKKRYKNCCGPADAAAARRLASGILVEPVAQGMPAIYV